MAATPQESFRERQIQELEAIKSIFLNDVEDLRPSTNSEAAATQWKPNDIRITLLPSRGSSDGQKPVYVHTKLHVTCASKYPKVAPKLALEESKGLSDQLIEKLHQMLQEQSQELRGEVMIYQLTQTVQTFLHKHNVPPSPSLYDLMVIEKERREMELLRQQEEAKSREKQLLMSQVERRKEELKTEGKRREPRRSMSESNRYPSSSESSENSSPYYRGLVMPSKCLDHRNTEDLYIQKIGRHIRRGSCLGHSQKGFIAFTGMDMETGQLLYITEWNVKYSQIELPCNNGGKCLWNPTELKCPGNHRTEDVTASIEKQVANLSQLHHKNLVQYDCVFFQKRKECFIVNLIQDFVLGTSVFSISSTLGWCVDGARMVARGVLNALVFLHNRGVSHSHLLDSTVFMDNTGTIRCTDFSLVPTLLELMGGPGFRCTHGDLPALGALVEGLMSTQTFEMRDFIAKCNSDRTLSASELLEHIFLRSALFTHDDKEAGGAAVPLNTRRGSLIPALNNAAQNQTLQVPAANQVPPLLPALSQSRLRTEFEVLMYLGKGAFGDVLKVRNILDNREYAIKRIPLPARSRQLYKKMTREVELLSRLNHENVVRYFNSWIESVNDEDVEEMDKLISGDWSISHDSIKPPASPVGGLKEETEDSSSSLWSGYIRQNMNDSDSDGIEFLNSDGEQAVYDEDEEEEEESESAAVAKAISPKPQMQVMYIQMEFCEKCTLRTAIDDNLYEDMDRVWRLFREIAEGLSHIHQQGIIHRDLKPVNIFLDSRDQIKIGDFGLATTSFLALQTQPDHGQHSHVVSTEEGTGTGKVGTTLYVAPELTGNASKSTYNQKVDMYTLGIIFFEMCQPPFSTGMGRAQTIMALRNANINLPNEMLQNNKYEKIIKIIRWLLQHDPSQRPTAEELLMSDLLPPAQLEANELQEMLRHALDNPQSKAYKHLVSRCLQQESDAVLEHTYHLGSSRTMKSWNSPIATDSIVSLNPIVECVKAKVVGLFRRHGGIEVDTPLLSPLSQHTNLWSNPVRLMTHSGCVVVLPTDLRTQFARHVTMNGVNMIRRYCIDRVYREEKVFNFHPRQTYECAFDIITPNTASHLADAELLSLAFEIATEITQLRDKNITIRMNHTNLLRAILLYCNVPKSKYTELFGNIIDYLEGRISKFQLQSGVTPIMEASRSSASALIELILSNFLFGGSQRNVDDTMLKSLVRGKGEAASLAKAALRELETIVTLAQSLGVTCPIHIYAGLPISFDRASSGGIVWQMMADLKPMRSSHPSTVLAMGERYDSLLHEFQKEMQSFNVNMPVRNISGAGLTVSLDKLVAAMSTDCEKDCRSIDVGVCVTGTRPPLKDVTSIIRLLWATGVRCGIVESAESVGDDALDLAKLGAIHVIFIAENGEFRIRTWSGDRFHEKPVSRNELTEFIQKTIRSEAINDCMNQLSISGNSGGGGGNSSNALSTSSSSSNVKMNNNSSGTQLPSVSIVFVTVEKSPWGTQRRRHENMVLHHMSNILSQFNKKENFAVVATDLPSYAVNAIVGAINPRDIDKKETEQEINYVIEKISKNKSYTHEVCKTIVNCLKDPKTTIVALYSLSDAYYRVII